MSEPKLSDRIPAETTSSNTENETAESISTNDEAIREQSELSKDLIFELLKESRRRLVLKYLNDNGGIATLGEMADHIAAEENDCDQSQISSDERKRAYVGLYQCHLPKLDDANVIDFDRPRGDIELRDEADELLSYLYFDQLNNERETDIQSIKNKLCVVRNYLFES